MPVKTTFASREAVTRKNLPQYDNGTYTVIPHQFVIDATHEEMNKRGFSIRNEVYKEARNCDIVQGIYHLDFEGDPEMGLMFAWTNSYDKSIRFKCAIGAHVFVCDNGVISGDMGSWARKHTGTADQEALQHIQLQLSNAMLHYNQLVKDKEVMKDVILGKKDRASILGRLFADQEILTLTQLGIVKRELDKPSFNYNADKDSAWSLYNHVTLALKESHPLQYIHNHGAVHKLFMEDYTLSTQTLAAPVFEIPVVEAYEEEAFDTSDSTVIYL